MRYTHFEITDFRGIKSLKLDLSRRPNSPIYTLVGLNESGKTTILEAINSFTYGAENLEALKLHGYVRPNPNDLIPISQRANLNGSINVEVGIELDEADQKAVVKHLKEEYDLKHASVSKEFTVTDVYPFKDSKHNKEDKQRLWSLSVQGRTGNQRNARAKGSKTEEWRAAVKFLGSRMPRIWYFPNFLFDFPDRIYLHEYDSLGEEAVKRNRFYLGVLQDILDTLPSNANVKEHLLDRATSSDKRDRRNLDGLRLEMGRSVTQRVFSTWQRMFGHSFSDKRVEVVIDHDEDDRWFAAFRIEDGDGFFAISERSLGFRWFFVYLLLTTYRTLRSKSERNMLLLLDEPASNLHSTAQRQLRKSFEPLSDRCTIIYTTHSHHLIEPRWLESTFVVRNAGLEYGGDPNEYHAKKTDIQAFPYRQFVATYPNQTSYFQPILDVLEYQPSALEHIPSVVMVEGKNDYYLLSLMARYVETDEALSFLPGGGAGSLDAPIQLYLAWSRDFVALLDSDYEGASQKDRYSSKFGSIVEGRVFNLSDLAPKVGQASLDRVLSSEDQLKLTQVIAAEAIEPKKKIMMRAVQESLMTDTGFVPSDESRANFTPILEGLTQRLRMIARN